MAENQSNGLENEGVRIILKCNKSEKELHVIMKRNVKIKTVLRGFCQHASVDYRSTRFVLHDRHDKTAKQLGLEDGDHGRTFSYDKTAKQLGLEDGDQIDALTEASGA